MAACHLMSGMKTAIVGDIEEGIAENEEKTSDEEEAGTVKETEIAETDDKKETENIEEKESIEEAETIDETDDGTEEIKDSENQEKFKKSIVRKGQKQMFP